MKTMPDHPLQPGDSAPSFQLPAVNRDGVVSLDDYRGKCAVMVGLFKGLHCPFCRRHIARLAVSKDKLAEQGVATVVIVNTQLERARQYFRYRPTRVELASDPEVQTHRAFGVSKVVILPDTADPAELKWPKTATFAQLMSISINPTGELPQKMNIMAASELLNQQDGFEMTAVDQQMFATHGMQFNSQFLIDATGVIRWSYVEAQGGPDELCRMPGEDEMIAAANIVMR
jgi:peroxiredoxin